MTERSVAIMSKGSAWTRLVVFIAAVGILFFFNLNQHIQQNEFYTGKSTGEKQTAVVSTKAQPTTPSTYHPSSLESYVMDHSKEFGFEGENLGNTADGCKIWTDPTATTIYDGLQTFRAELQEYQKRMDAFNGTVRDLRHHLHEGICDTLELHEEGLKGIFSSGSLSNVPGAGLVEPLLTPLRHPEFCYGSGSLMDLGYLVHDFASLCRKLKRESRTVFVDMGAALDFHAGMMSPAVYITQVYQKFGFHFDHVYAYEINKKEPDAVYMAIPDDLKAAYHWYNVGVDADSESSSNPLKLLFENFNEDDFIVIKLDIDTSSIEVPMAHMLLEDERLHNLVDCFYFEHHVFLKELAPYWGASMGGSVHESLNFFKAMRERGIASHYWP